MVTKALRAAVKGLLQDGVSQREIARMADISPSMLCRWLRDEVRFGQSTIDRLADALKVEISIAA